MRELPDVVTTLRLRLVVIGPDEADAMLAGHREPFWAPGYPRQDDLDAVSMIKDASSWAPRHIVRSSDGSVVGSIGFFGPPVPSADEVPEVEVGYGLVPAARGHGVATEALMGLIAELDPMGIRVRANGVLPDNTASLRVLTKCGFTVLPDGDEDGNLVMVRSLPGW